jgi:hypothetical protein
MTRNSNPLHPEKLNFNYFNYRDKTTWPTGYGHWPFLPRRREPLKVTLGPKEKPQILKVVSIHKNQGIIFEGHGLQMFSIIAWENGYRFERISS